MRWRFVRRHWRRLAAMCLVALLILAALLAFIEGSFQRGFVVGVILTGASASIFGLVVQHTGTGSRAMGATAEQWTASELRPLRRYGWHVVNHVALRQWDIDHVLVGPGGVVAVETKWSARAWQLDPPDERVIAAVRRVSENAKHLRLWQPLRSRGVTAVGSAVYLWGEVDPATSRPGGVVHRVDGVAVVVGSAAEQWRSEILHEGDAAYDADTVRQLWEALDDQVRVRDDVEKSDHPAPPAIERLWMTAVAMLTSAALAFVLCIQSLATFDTWWSRTISALTLIAVGLIALRSGALRLPAYSWLAGIAIAGALVLAVVVDATVSSI